MPTSPNGVVGWQNHHLNKFCIMSSCIILTLWNYFTFSIKAIMVGSPFPIDFPSDIVSKFELDYLLLLKFISV